MNMVVGTGSAASGAPTDAQYVTLVAHLDGWGSGGSVNDSFKTRRIDETNSDLEHFVRIAGDCDAS